MPTKKTCERCKKEFICSSDDINACQCQGFIPTIKASEEIAKFKNCLCRGCLDEINENSKKKQ